MKNWETQKGFIQIPILIVVLVVTTLVGGGGYAVYEATKPEAESIQEESANTSEKAEIGSIPDSSDEITTEQDNKPKETDKNNENTSDEKDSIIESLQKQIEVLTNTKSEPIPAPTSTSPQPQTVTLPNGAIIEVDESGEIIRTLQEASTPTINNEQYTQAQTTNTLPIISNIDIKTTRTSSSFEWTTSVPTNSKIFVSGGNISATKIINSSSGLSTQHYAVVSGLVESTAYTYTIEAIAGDGVSVGKRQGSFETLSPPAPAKFIGNPVGNTSTNYSTGLYNLGIQYKTDVPTKISHYVCKDSEGNEKTTQYYYKPETVYNCILTVIDEEDNEIETRDDNRFGINFHSTFGNIHDVAESENIGFYVGSYFQAKIKSIKTTPDIEVHKRRNGVYSFAN